METNGRTLWRTVIEIAVTVLLVLGPGLLAMAATYGSLKERIANGVTKDEVAELVAGERERSRLILTAHTNQPHAGSVLRDDYEKDQIARDKTRDALMRMVGQMEQFDRRIGTIESVQEQQTPMLSEILRNVRRE